MDKLVIERTRGGINPLKGRGELETASLSAEVRAAVEACFTRREVPPRGDEPVYKVTRVTPSGARSVDVPEHLMPEGLVLAIKDELA